MNNNINGDFNMEENKYKDKVACEELLKLANEGQSEISIYNLSEWLKVVTNDKYTVVPKEDLRNLDADIFQLKITSYEAAHTMEENIKKWCDCWG